MDVVNIAKELIKKDDIDVVIGYGKGRAPLQNIPFFAHSPEECDRMVMDPLCVHNLSTYLKDIKKYKGRVAIFTKPCDTKAIIGLLQEHQIEREKVYIVSIKCPGVISSKELKKAMKGKKIKDWTINGNKIKITHEKGTEELNLNDFTMEKCKSCDTRTAPLYDQLIGEEVKVDKVSDEFEPIKKIENMSLHDRQTYWNSEFSKCIRCYACVKTCPLCYCDRCFVETSSPQWIDKTIDTKANKAFHLIRALHLAGRCIDCGECDRACPMDIPLRELNLKMRKSVKEHFDYVPGKDPNVPIPLSTFKKEDKENFIR